MVPDPPCGPAAHRPTALESADAGTHQRLLAILDTLGRQAGCGDAFDEWEADYAWMQQYQPPVSSP